MPNKNLMSERDREMQEKAEAFQQAKQEGRSFYMDADELADLADWCAMHSRVDQAFEVAHYGLKIHPRNTALLVELAYLHLDDGDIEGAEKVAKHIEEPKLPEVIILQANLKHTRGQYEEADNLVNTLDKDDLSNIIDVCYMYLESERPEKAYPWLQRGERLYLDEPSFMAVDADYSSIMGEWERAINLYNTLLDKEPYNPNYWYGLAKVYLFSGELDKAIDACDYALLSDEKHGIYYLTKAMAYSRLGNIDQCLECFRQAYRYHAIDRATLRVQEALASQAKGETAKALDLYRQFFAENNTFIPGPANAMAYANAALCLHDLKGDKKEKYDYINRVLEGDADIETLAIVGFICIDDAENFADAFRWKYAVKGESEPDVWAMIAELAMVRGRMELNREALRRIEELDPHYEHLYEKLAISSLILKDIPEFIRYNSLCDNPMPKEELLRWAEWSKEQHDFDISYQTLRRMFRLTNPES